MTMMSKYVAYIVIAMTLAINDLASGALGSDFFRRRTASITKEVEPTFIKGPSEVGGRQ